MERARAAVTSVWGLGIFVFLLSWGGGLVAPHTISIDDSFHAGLNMATVEGLQFGTDVAVTYGPLGFLKSYIVFYEWPARLAILYGLALHLALSVSLVWVLRRNYGIAVSVLVAALAAVLMRGDLSAIAVRDDAGVVTLAALWGIAALSASPPRFARLLVVYGGGVFAAIEVLAKLNTGLFVLAVVGIAAFAMEGDRRRNLAALAATFAGTTAVLWLASGQGIDTVGPYVSRSLEVVRGYSSGALLDWGNRDYDYAAIPLVLLGSAALAWVASRGRPTLRRVAMLAIFAVIALTAVKSGLVSHDPFHMATLYGTMLGLSLAFTLSAGPAVRVSALVVALAIAVLAFTTADDGYPLVNPAENVANAAETVFTAAVPGELGDEVERGRAELIAAHGIDPESLALLEGHSVHVDPSEASAAWAHELDWEPPPVYQPYIAWTPELDELNAEALASPDGPERILRQNLNALGRYPAYESPAAMIAMLCNFAPLRTTDRWQVLGRVPDRCGEPEPIGTAEAAFGERVAVPPAPPGSVVFARVEGVDDSGLRRLIGLLTRPEIRTINFDSGGTPSSLLAGTPHTGLYTFLPATAGDGLIMSVPPEADAPGPFRLSPAAKGFAIHRGRDVDDEPSGEFEVEFFAMPIEPNRPPAEG